MYPEKIKLPCRAISEDHHRNNAIKAGMSIWSSLGDTSACWGNNSILTRIAMFLERPVTVPFLVWLKFCWYEIKDMALVKAKIITIVKSTINVEIKDGVISVSERGRHYVFDSRENCYVLAQTLLEEMDFAAVLSTVMSPKMW